MPPSMSRSKEKANEQVYAMHTLTRLIRNHRLVTGREPTLLLFFSLHGDQEFLHSRNDNSNVRLLRVIHTE